MILIVASPEDDHVAAVAPELRRRGASVLCLDLAELPAQAELSVAFESGTRARPMLRVRDTEVDLRAVTAAWSLRSRPPSPHADVPTEALRDYVRQETTDAWIGVTELLDCLWLPGPRWQELRAGYKPLQLRVAAELGFEIPATLVTNSPDDFLAFYGRQKGAAISKTLHNRLVPPGGREGHDGRDAYDAYALTEVVANRDVGYRNAIQHCPVTLQSYVEKHVELRITVVGDRVFPAAVQSQWSSLDRYDWRRGDPNHSRYAIHALPQRVARRCVKLVHRLGLRFGAIDMILTPDGRYVFLEINPSGSWLWVERTTGLPIRDAVCDLLLSRETTAPRTQVPADAHPSRSAAPLPVRNLPILTPPLAAVRRTRPRVPRAVDAALEDTLRYLVRLAHAGVGPAEARAGLRRLAKRHRGTDLRLVWEIEGYLGTVHYDGLIRLPGVGTISLGLSPDRGVPWALRHAHHARETDLLRVNGQTLSMQTVMGYLDGLWKDANLVARLVDGCLVREAIESRGIVASDDEVRAAVRVFRREQRLTSVKARDAWLRQRGWTQHELEHESRRQLVANKLRKQIAAGRVRSYFTDRQRQLDTAEIVRLRSSDREAAAPTAPGMSGGAVETVRHRDLAPGHARAIFGARPGMVVGPLETGDGYDVVRVLRIARARFDEPTRELITQLLFEEWLAARRAEASVEWFWGDSEETAARLRDVR